MSDTFDSQKLNASQLDDIAEIREAAYALEAAIDNASIADRYKAIAMTHLETALMMANKGISRVWM